MIAYLKGKAVTKVTEILMEGRIYEEDEIRTAIKSIPPKKIKKAKK